MFPMSELNSNLVRFDSLPPLEAESEFLKCCGSENWAALMTEGRPYKSLAELKETAERIWWSLKPEDWLQAFKSHPKIGETRPQQNDSKVENKWSQQEQSGVGAAAKETIDKLAELNRDYEAKFGYIFIVCATGRSAGEMLTILQGRLLNDPEKELPIAAAEQAKITALRLEKLLNE